MNKPWKMNLIGQAGTQNEIEVFEIRDAKGTYICQVSGVKEAGLIVDAVNAYDPSF